MKRISLIAVLGLALFTAAAVAESPGGTAALATRDWAVQTFKNTCSACHGTDGAHPVPLPGNPPPIIAGQYEDYLVQALTEYRDGQRQNIIMAPQAKALTNAQVRAIAAYISELPSPLHTLPRPELAH
ncbi:MAG: c-type cytochrome [Gammaproteobacteria bacterium]|nr:c-type cytochrome [Gammaproteobacteria bacterium]MDE2345169.1 c-type cytochrome [Gammaproteobacteria bacterium]